MKVNFNTSDFQRKVADAADLILKNRYFEQNPSLTDDGSALIARPGMKRLAYIGTGPIRGLASEAGSFGGDLFVASGDSVWRMDNKLNKASLFSGLYNPDRGVVRMAITAQIGDLPEYLYVADGRNLFVYLGNGFAQNTLTGTPANNDVVRIDNTYYKFTNASVNAGTPAGTLANPWLVNLGAAAINAFNNLFNAINLTGIAGTDYSTATVKHANTQAVSYTSTSMSARSILIGALGNTTVTTETGAVLSWTNGGTMTGGGAASVTTVQMPDDIGVIDVAVIASFVIVIPAQNSGYQGRFFWIEPGEVTVDPLNFATAERSPDAIFGVQVFGDQFWLPGESTTEVWYVAGSSSDPTEVMQRVRGIVIDRGSWENTARAVHETLVAVDADGGVFLINGSSPQRVSTPAIEEQIRLAMAKQGNYLY